MFRLKRAYDAVGPDDGIRILVDRLWPRGVSKEDAHIDLWCKEIAPSPALRKWFNHEPEKWELFRARYLAELENQTEWVAQLRAQAIKGSVTLVYGAKDGEHNHALVLKEFLMKRRRRTGDA